MRESRTISLEPLLQAKLDACRDILRRLQRVVVAFSGGVDSSLLLALSADTLGRDNVLAVMAVSTIFPQRERKAGEETAREIGVEFIEVETPQLADPSFTSNPADRCYYCKTTLMHKLKELAAERGFSAVVSGANIEDEADFRPGSRAEIQLGIHRPLLDAGLTKQEIRQVSAAMGLSCATRPSMACLATRVPYGQPITEAKLSRIERGEELLRSLGFSQCRLRDHDPIARIELPLNEFELAMRLRDKIVAGLKELGYTFIVLDLQGFRSGSMNEMLRR